MRIKFYIIHLQEHNNDSSVYLSTPLTVTNTVCPTTVTNSDPNDRLHFHQRCGSMIRLSDNARFELMKLYLCI